MKWTTVALLAFIIILCVIMYQNGKKYAQRQGERLIIEKESAARNIRISELEDSLTTKDKELKEVRKEKQKIKFIYHEIPNIINTIAKSDSGMVADGFHLTMSPCE